MNNEKLYILHSKQGNKLLPLEIFFSREAVQAKMEEAYGRHCKEAVALDEQNSYFLMSETAAHAIVCLHRLRRQRRRCLQ